jgi:hypothetical protein
MLSGLLPTEFTRNDAIDLAPRRSFAPPISHPIQSCIHQDCIHADACVRASTANSPFDQTRTGRGGDPISN